MNLNVIIPINRNMDLLLLHFQLLNKVYGFNEDIRRRIKIFLS